MVDYNVALAALEFARGTVLERNNVTLSEGELPACAQVRAVVHERQRTRALVLREKANPVIYPPVASDHPEIALLPNLPDNAAPTLPALLQNLPDVPPSLDARASLTPNARETPVHQVPPARLGIPAASD